MQLQANMVLAVVSVLKKKILSNEVSMAEILSMTKLSCYGLSFSLHVNFELLKLEIDFKVGTFNFYVEYGPTYWICAISLGDIAIDYVVSKLLLRRY